MIVLKTTSFEDFLSQQDFFIREAKAGKIFVYPTDTIYGIGWIINQHTVTTIDAIKQRKTWKHYSIIAPNPSRVEKHFDVKNFELFWNSTKSWLEQWRWLTVLCPILSEHKNTIWIVSSNSLVWIRFIEHPFQNFVSKLWAWFVSTSCNISWQENIKQISEINSEQKKLIDYSLNNWKKQWPWSVIVRYSDWEIVRE